jgi:hypothetical protein
MPEEKLRGTSREHPANFVRLGILVVVFELYARLQKIINTDGEYI